MSIGEQLRQRAAMGGETERAELAAFEKLLADAIAGALIAHLEKQAAANGVDVRSRPKPVLDQDEDLFLRRRCYLAFSLRNFLDEILAELYLKSAYPAYLDRRIAYYLDLRRGASLTAWQDATPTLRPTTLLLEIVKNDLGTSMAEGRPEAAEFTAMSSDLEGHLRDHCDDDEFRRLMELRQRIMSARLEPLTYDRAVYDDAFTTTIALPR